MSSRYVLGVVCRYLYLCSPQELYRDAAEIHRRRNLISCSRSYVTGLCVSEWDMALTGGIRRWIQNPNRCADEYLDGIEDFIEFARRHNPGATRIRCPCRGCNDTLWETIENVGFHLVRNGMIETYNIWNLHGEQLDNVLPSNATRVDNVEPIVDPNEQVMDIINDAFPFALTNINQEGEDDVPTPTDSAEFEQSEQLLQNANQELYLECESFSVLTAIS
ncbi:unnamed protein product [Prunus armeniaca]